MPGMRSMPGMYNNWGYRSSSLLTWLLLLAIVVLAVLYFRQRKTIENLVHNNQERSAVVAESDVVETDKE